MGRDRFLVGSRVSSWVGQRPIRRPGPAQDPAIPAAPTATNGSHTLSGTLIQTFTASGTFTPPAGVTRVDIVVIGGGGNGDYTGEYYRGNGGGSGGSVRVYRNVPVTGNVSVTVGGAATASSFGSYSASAGQSGSGFTGGRADALRGVSDGGNEGTGANAAGKAGVTVNGVTYGGGGGGGGAFGDNTPAGAAGAGGGGAGARMNMNTGGGSAAGTGGANTGGGGGGGSSGGNPAAAGGSGRVMVFTATQQL